MIVLERGQTYGPADPRLVFYALTDGWLQDIASLEFQLFDTSTEEKQLNPVQVYPAQAGTRASVDVTHDAPTGDRLSRGRYCARVTLDALLNPGLYELHWFYRWTGGEEVRVVLPLEVLANLGTLRDPLYAAISDVRSEGVAVSAASDARVLLAIARASRYIEQVTGRFFEPRFLELRANGRGHGTLLLGQPVIAISEIEFPLSTISQPDPDSYVVYNRHLDGLLSPDDRANPKIEVVYSDLDILSGEGGFSRGKQNVKVRGVFGYTEPDGSMCGKTPELVRRVCTMLVVRDVFPLGSDERAEQMNSYRLVSETTRDQSYQLGAPSSAGTKGGTARAFTGNPEIDSILALFLRPPQIGAV